MKNSQVQSRKVVNSSDNSNLFLTLIICCVLPKVLYCN